MKKFLKWAIFILVMIMAAIYFLLPPIGLKMITDYTPYTFEKVLNDSALRADYGIGQYSSPSDYGFDASEVNFYGLDSTRLNGWYVPGKNEVHHCLIFVHGRTSNRLKTMKFLALVDSFDLDEQYNIFIPDLRNSGKSQPAKTYMGYKFAEDAAAAMEYMHNTYQQDTFLLYGFSMGAMAILNTEGRTDLQKMLKKDQLVIERVVLDSPLSNVKATLEHSIAESALIRHFFDDIYSRYDKAILGNGDKMKLSALIDLRIPTLILQSSDDRTTPLDVLEGELNALPKDHVNLRVEYFDGPDHVRMFQDKRTRQQYLSAVESFLHK